MLNEGAEWRGWRIVLLPAAKIDGWDDEMPCVLTYTQFTMLRDLEGKQFADAVNEKLGPRMQLTGTGAPLACMHVPCSMAAVHVNAHVQMHAAYVSLLCYCNVIHEDVNHKQTNVCSPRLAGGGLHRSPHPTSLSRASLAAACALR